MLIEQIQGVKYFFNYYKIFKTYKKFKEYHKFLSTHPQAKEQNIIYVPTYTYLPIIETPHEPYPVYLHPYRISTDAGFEKGNSLCWQNASLSGGGYSV